MDVWYAALGIHNYTSTSYIGLGILVTCLSLVLWGEFKKKIIWVALFKPLSSLGFLIFAYAGWVEGQQDIIYQWAIWVALLLSALGDVLLIKQDDKALLLGLAAFLLAHVAYCVACLLEIYSVFYFSILVMISLVGGVFAYRYFKTSIPHDLQKATIAYIIVIAMMVASALNYAYVIESVPLAIAAVAFWWSDISVANARFMQAGFVNRLWGLPLYYLAQILFASTLYVHP